MFTNSFLFIATSFLVTENSSTFRFAVFVSISDNNILFVQGVLLQTNSPQECTTKKDCFLKLMATALSAKFESFSRL